MGLVLIFSSSSELTSSLGDVGGVDVGGGEIGGLGGDRVQLRQSCRLNLDKST